MLPFVISISFLSLLLLHLPSASARLCKVIPSDKEWPSDNDWKAFNRSVDGRLIKTVPLALPCYQAGFDSAQCIDVRANWHLPEFHEPTSSSIMSAPFSNRSCDPFSPALGCTNRHYVEYSVNVTSQDHILKSLKFVKKHNIRFVIRNTGHDYMGKSTGHGALAIWTHHLTKTKWISSYDSQTYRGPAVKAQAGVSMKQMYTEASQHGYAIIGGDCPTVGMAGGFVQGGGLGPLSGTSGLLADNTLEFEIITTSGQILTASAKQNPDLYWAMSGGGGGTYAILWSVTVKVQPDVSIASGSFQFTVSNTTTLDQWWAGVNAYRLWTPTLTAAGGYALAIYFRGFFLLAPALIPNTTLEEFSVIFDPLLQKLGALGIEYSTPRKDFFPGFLQAHTSLFPEFNGTGAFDIQNTIGGGRLIPGKMWDSEATLKPVNDVIRQIVDDGATGYEIAITPSKDAAGSSATLPQWRTSKSALALFVNWNDTGTYAQYQQQQSKVTNVYMEALKSVTPGGGAYLNEADAFDKDWKETFYGVNYKRLLSVKKKWDPDYLLYGSTSVGGDFWEVQADGRLCRA